MFNQVDAAEIAVVMNDRYELETSICQNRINDKLSFAICALSQGQLCQTVTQGYLEKPDGSFAPQMTNITLGGFS